MTEAENNARKHDLDGYVMTDPLGDNWTRAIARRFAALYPKEQLRVSGVWGSLRDCVIAKINAQGWACLADVAEFVERWKPDNTDTATPVEMHERGCECDPGSQNKCAYCREKDRQRLVRHVAHSLGIEADEADAMAVAARLEDAGFFVQRLEE